MLAAMACYRDLNFFQGETVARRNIHLENCYYDVHSRMILPNGKIYQKHCGVTTGFEYTAGQNTDIHNVAFIASIASSKIDFNSVNAKMYGDDNKGYYDPDVKHPFNFDGFRTGMKIFGYSLTDMEDRDNY